MDPTQAWPVRVRPVGPVAVGTVLWRSGGQTSVTVIVKAAFAFATDAAMALLSPEPLRTRDKQEDLLGSRWGVRETAPQLQQADVLLTGSVRAPVGARKRSIVLSVERDDEVLLRKKLVVCGDRTEESAEPAVFRRLPLIYARTWGGIGCDDNPLGVGKGGCEGKVPNVFYPDQAGKVASFGPVPCTFPVRKKLLRGYPRARLEQRVAEIPPGFDWSYFQAAPEDQRIDRLQGDEWIALEGIHPTLATVRMRLPDVRAEARVYALASSSAPEQVSLVADTLLIDADRERCALLWRGSFPVADVPSTQGLVVVGALELPERPIDWPDAAELERAQPRSGAPDSSPSDAAKEDSDAPPQTSPYPMLSSEAERGSTPSAPYALADGPSSKSPDADLPGAPWARARAKTSGVVAPTGLYESTLSLAPEPDEPQDAHKALGRAVGRAAASAAASPSPRPAGSGAAASPSPRPAGSSAAVDPSADGSALPRPGQSPWAAASATDGKSKRAPSVSPSLGRSSSPAAAVERDAAGKPRPAAARLPSAVQHAPRTVRATSLLWHDPTRTSGLRRVEAWAPIIAAISDRAADVDLDAAASDDDQAESRNEVFELLARAPVTHLEALEAALSDAVKQDGKLFPPLVLTAGELEMGFDEAQILKATVDLVRPDAAGDEQLREVVAAVDEALDAPPLPAAVAAEMTAELRDAFAEGDRVFPSAELDGHARRVMLQQRQYRMRTVLGEPHVCARLCPYESGPEAAAAIVTYLPCAAAEHLPLAPRFDVRLLGELHLRQDEQEPHPGALRVVAIGRMSTMRA